MPSSHSREHVLHLLVEAAELEHNILCSYLFALFSLKQGRDEDLEEEEFAAVGRWRKELSGVAIEEMLHLAQVNNILSAVGARPHFNRPNLPVAAGYHPAGIVLELAPFTPQTLDHFIYLERPEEADVRDSAKLASIAAARAQRRGRFHGALMPGSPEYETIGAFYRELLAALKGATAELGEQQLFCGPVAVQMRGDEVGGGELVAVTDLASAEGAILQIIEQGEGAHSPSEEAHFDKFEAIRTEYEAMLAKRPAFRPCRPVATNPVMHTAVTAGRVHVSADQAARMLDAANASYGAMLRCLGLAYEVPAGEAVRRSAVLKAAIACMHLLMELGCALTRLPATEGGALNAGVSFAMQRATEGFASGQGHALVSEQLLRLHEAAAAMAPHAAQGLAEAARKLGAR
ncbi:MAG TPA: ferritin-like protein [Ramlibacter sp.]